MKRITAILMAIAIALLITGCGNNSTDSTNAAVTATPAPAATPVPVLTPTPVPILNADSYVMQWKNDAGRGINYQVPTHWKIQASGERYIVFYEPVPDGESGFRVAYVNKKKSAEPNAEKMRSELKKLISEMQGMYQDFKWNNEIIRDYYLVKFKGYAAEYTYTDENGTPMQGFVIMSTYDRRIYCMNYSGPQERYTEMKGIFNKMLDNMTRVA